MAHISNPKPTHEDLCVICGKPYASLHEVFFGSNSNNSIKYKCQEILCIHHHQDNIEFDLSIKIKHKNMLEKTMTRNEFRKIFHKSWL